MIAEFEVFVTDKFETWYEELDETDGNEVYRVVELLVAKGVYLGHPYSSQIKGSTYPLRELRIQSKGRPLRVLYAFDPRRNALLLLGGDKGGDDRWYEIHIPQAEAMWEAHLASLLPSELSEPTP